MVDASREHSPLKCEFAVDSTIPENTRNHVDADYRYYGAERSTAEGSDTEPSYACMHSLRLQGAQKFRLKNWKLTDLAGNTTICTPSHTVFLDTDVPEDELSPAIKVAASVPEATRDGHGQDLFSGDVPVLINVRDPDGKTSSSGLGEIRYTLFMDGAVVREEILRHNPLLSQSNVAYEDLALATDWSGQVQVPSGVCNHNDLVLAAMGIVMKVERVPNAVNIGICQGMLPMVAFNFASGNHQRMKEVMRTARLTGLVVSFACMILFELFADKAAGAFLSTSAGDAATAVATVGYAALFLRIRCLASPVQFLNYSTSYSMQAMGNGRGTLLHAFVRELVFYIPLMFLLDRLFGEVGLAAALPVGEACGAAFALWLMNRWLKAHSVQESCINDGQIDQILQNREKSKT